MAFVEDFRAYMADFGVQATIAGVPARVIFDNRYAEAFDMAMSTSAPQAGLPTENAGAAAQGGTVVIGGVSYRITAVQPDGTGWTVLKLQESAA